MVGEPNAKWYRYDHMRNVLRIEVYMGLDLAYYKLWKLQAYLIKHMSKHYCCDQDLAWVLSQDNSY